MNRIICLCFSFLVAIFSVYAQETSITYWNSNLTAKVDKKDARFLKTIMKYANGITVTEIIDIKTDEIIDREVFNGKEPCDIWIKKIGDEKATIDYNFDLKYSDSDCPDDKLPEKLKLFMFDDKRRGYTAPCIATGETDLQKYLHKRIFAHYDAFCKMESKPKPARVIARFTITSAGNVTDISITKGVNPFFDKEAFRLLKELKFSNPPSLKGEAIDLCITCPILFDTRLFCPQPPKKK